MDGIEDDFTTPLLLKGEESPSLPRSMELAKVFVEEIDGFKKTHENTGFWGARCIWTVLRSRDTATILDGIHLPCIPVRIL
jgi:hypothetical protein